MMLTVICSTTYIGQVMAYENQKEPEHDKATRKGELALLLFSIGAKHSSKSDGAIC